MMHRTSFKDSKTPGNFCVKTRAGLKKPGPRLYVFMCVGFAYLVTLSSHLIMKSMVNIEIRHAVTNTPQVAQIGMLL